MCELDGCIPTCVNMKSGLVIYRVPLIVPNPCTNQCRENFQWNCLFAGTWWGGRGSRLWTYNNRVCVTGLERISDMKSRGSRSSGMWHCVFGWVVHAISKGTTILRNVREHLPSDAASHPRRPKGSVTRLRETEIFTSMSLFNPLSTKLYLSDLKTQFVPRSKHSLLRF